jgi:sugar phosphate isomerase/epimerase
VAHLLGVSTWSFPWAVGVANYPKPEYPLELRDLLRKANELHVAVVQIADNFPLHLKTENELRELKSMANDLGLILEVGTKGVEPDHLKQYLDIAEILGSKLIRTLTHSATTDPDIGQVASWITQVVPDLEAAGVSLAVENYERHPAKDFAWLIETVGSLNVGICLDTVNSFGALEGIMEVFDALAPYTINLHVKDFQVRRVDYQMGFAITGSPAGDGRLDVAHLLRRLAALHRKPNVILEQWPPFLGNIEDTVANEAFWAKRSICYLQKTMSEVVTKDDQSEVS